MRYAVISDIHANLDALKAVVDDLSANWQADRIFCCGDIVGYGPQPNECIEFIKSAGNIECVAGNHDWALIDRLDFSDFNDNAIAAINLHKKLVSAENVDFLRNLKTSLETNGLMFVHGSPLDHIKEYLNTREKLSRAAIASIGKIVFVGHTHTPLIYAHLSEKIAFIQHFSSGKITLVPSATYIINVGSVGQPRDGDNRACVLYYDTELQEIECRRIAYDIGAVCDRMKVLNMPDPLIKRLSEGS